MSPLDAHRHGVFGQLLLEDEEKDDGRNHRENDGAHHRVGVDGLFRAEHKQAHHHRLQRAAAKHQIWQEEVRPCGVDGENRNHGANRLGQRQDDVEERLQLRAAINPPGFDDGSRQRFKELHEQDNVHGIRAIAQPERDERAAEIQLLNVHEQWHDADGRRQEQGEHDQLLDDAVALGLQNRQPIAEQTVEHNRADDAARDGNQRVKVVLRNAQLRPRFREERKIEHLREQLGGRHELLQVLEARQHNPDNRENRDDRHNQAEEDDEPIPNPDRRGVHIVVPDDAGALCFCHMRSPSLIPVGFFAVEVGVNRRHDEQNQRDNHRDGRCLAIVHRAAERVLPHQLHQRQGRIIRAALRQHHRFIHNLEHGDDLQNQQRTRELLDGRNHDVDDALPDARAVNRRRFVQLRADTGHARHVNQRRRARALPRRNQDDDGDDPLRARQVRLRRNAQVAEQDVQHAGLLAGEECRPEDDDRQTGQHIRQIRHRAEEALAPHGLPNQQRQHHRQKEAQQQRPERIRERVRQRLQEVIFAHDADVIFEADEVHQFDVARLIQAHHHAFEQRFPDKEQHQHEARQHNQPSIEVVNRPCAQADLRLFSAHRRSSAKI